MIARRLQNGVGGNALVIHDVAQTPRAPGPRIGEIGGLHVVNEALAATRKFRCGQRDWSCNSRGGRLGEQSEDVLELWRAFGRTRPILVIDVAIHNAGLVALFQPPGHGRSDDVDAAPHQRTDRVRDRVSIWRHKKPRANGTHLVFVEPYLRKPLVVGGVRHRPRLFLREHVPVAVVVVPDVSVVEPRHTSAFVLRADVLAVPLGHHDLSIGIQRGHQQQNHIAQSTQRLRIFSGDECVRPLHRHLRRADLSRMDIACHQQDHFAVTHEAIYFLLRTSTRVGQLMRDLLILGLVLQILFGRDRGEDEVVIQRSRTHILHLNPRRLRCQVLEIGNDLVIVGKFAICTHFEAKKL